MKQSQDLQNKISILSNVRLHEVLIDLVKAERKLTLEILYL